jgi:hypothetical protein
MIVGPLGCRRAPGPLRPRCREATCRPGSARPSGPTPTSSALPRPWRQRHPQLPHRCCADWRVVTGRAWIGAGHGRAGRRSGAGLVRSRVALPAPAGMGARPTTCCGAAPSWACSLRRRPACGRAGLVPAALGPTGCLARGGHGASAARDRAARGCRHASVPLRPDPGAARRDRAAGRHAGRQDLADARDGRAGRAQCRPGAGRRAGRHRHAGAPTQRGHGLPAVHQLPVDDGGRQHRLAAAAARRDGPCRHPGPGGRTGGQAAHRALSRTPAGRALGRAAAARGPGPGAGQERRR